MRKNTSTFIYRFLLVALVSFPLFLVAAHGGNPSSILAIGEQKLLEIPPGAKFSLGNPEVISAKITSPKGEKAVLLIKGKSQGYSDLLVFDPSGESKSLEFRVISKKQASLAGDSEKLLPLANGLKIEPLGTGWVATGKTNNLDEWNRLNAIGTQGKGQFHGFAKLHPMERLKAESRIQRIFRQANLEHLRVRGAGSYVILDGLAKSKEEKLFAEELAGQIFRPLKSFLEVPFEKGNTLRYRAKILEVLKSNAKEFGLDWEQGVPAVLSMGKGSSKGDFQVGAALKFLEKTGAARVLSQPELLLNEKGIAELKVGGEIPISLKTKESASVHWKSYGLLLRLEVPGSSRKQARTKILMELSSLDPANGIDDIPGIRISRMETIVDLRLGSPVLLSGLMDQRQARSIRQFPFLAELPILGSLFQSENFQENQSELVIAIEAFPAN
jgi:Flp pilus assembly secretin CpaC